MTVSVIIPALNEAESIGFVLDELRSQPVAECIVVDNGSTDATEAISLARGARVVHAPRGYGAACMAGALAGGAAREVLVVMAGDGSDIAGALEDLTGPIARGEQDFVMGTRLGSQRRAAGSMLPSQVFAGTLVGTLLRWIYGFRYTDMGPFRAIRRSSLLALDMRERTYGWSLEMQIKAVQHRLRILEVPVGYRVRYGGTSKVSGDLRASLKAATRILEVLARVTMQGKAQRGPTGTS